ncbi:MAG: amidohydrolase family protein [Gemmatimonadetes bacterium]|nr:amidohydrolase family protein [Gemmatimonadota bacterium]MBK6779995.1 amidohydrolase family protein [Gemmatimonadota bacterium]MBK7716880.1 amidohydrolase family protein [Gemmatimonadota bacterium]MBK7922264.1 amidohydrolase family protein [Gemmatimonadota bacterium]MBK9067039.1 amidohydrolase family protein [Gemmatimonadota bacterium]
MTSRLGGSAPRRLGVLLLLGVAAPPLQAQLAVRADTLYTMAGAPIPDGVVLVGKDGKIEAVGPAARVRIPRGVRTLTARIVTPGLVDAHTVVGLAGALNYAHDQDQLETSDPIQPELRAFDAYDARERLVEWVRGFGVTTLHTGHGPGALMSGQTMVVKTRGSSVAEALVDSVTMVAMTLGPDVSDNFRGKSPGTRAKGVAMLRAAFLKGQDYARKRADPDSTKRPARDLRQEAIARVLEGRAAALITAHGMSEILAALRLQREFGFRLVLDGAAESYMLVDEIRAAGVPVILHPSMIRNTGSASSASLETAATLVAAGIPVALQSGFEGYVPKTRVVLFEAAVAAANGLTREQALATITRDAARVIGQDRRVGTLEVGKDGDLALFDGDPFEYTSHVCAVVIEGAVVADRCR